MAPWKSEQQLDLFAWQPSARPPHRETVGRFLLQARYDQLVLAGIVGLIGMTVVFACGVERGKQLARAERALLTREEPRAPAPAAVGTEPSMASQAVPAVSPVKGGESEGGPVPSLKPLTPKAKPPSKPGVGKSRYAVQVVTYSRPHLAKQELQRLKANGEPAFLVMRDGRTRVYVGPFPTKGNAQEQVARLKARYQDCFVRSL
jgi:cell division protein FtsN